MNTRKLPYGVQDCLPKTAAARQKLCAGVSKVFEKWGASPIEPPAVDYADNFIHGRGAVPVSRMFKLSDNDGSLLVLRPDTTMQIARIAATKLYTEKELKLYYCLNSYENNDGRQGNRAREFLQCGAEYFNAAGAAADADMIALSISALTSAGVRDFQIEIGQVGFYQGLLSNSGLSVSEEDELRGLLSKKDVVGAAKFLSGRIDAAAAKKLLKLASLFGGAEVLNAAARLSDNAECRAALDNLNGIYELLKARGLEKYACFDLGLISGAGYYTGVVFRGISKNLGAPILEGGRYDGLTGNFGKPMPAVGFALGADRALSAVTNKAGKPEAGERTVIALAKGRLADKAIELLSICGLDCEPLTADTRKLVLSDGQEKFNFIFVKPADVAVYVERGAADIGFVGKDTLLEDPRDIYEVLDLKYAACRLSVAGRKGQGARAERGDVRVATKYPETAKRYYHARGQNAEIIKLNGSIELAPILGLSDVIVDIVESGNTLKANDLEEYVKIADISARLIVNKVSYKTRANEILPLVAAIEKALPKK